MKTIGVELWGGQARGAGKNHMTCMRPSTQPVLGRSLRELFVGAYATFAGRCREVDEPAIAMVAVDERTGRAVGIARVRARVDRHVAAIVGRHDACDLYLNASDRLALRHLAVVLDPVTSWKRGQNGVRYRVLDLRTADGFTDEHGRTLRGLRCEGPALIRCAGHALFILPLGDPSDWPESAEDAWAFLPERVYFDELDQNPAGSLPRYLPMPRPDLRRSLIIRTHGPRETGVNLTSSGDIAGVLELTGPRQHGTIQVGHDELNDGVLLGRYARCDGAQLTDDPSLSRVHALLIQVDDQVLLIDTASINGTCVPGSHRARVIALDGSSSGNELQLGTGTRVRWRWVAA